jgi:hypothetical protein
MVAASHNARCPLRWQRREHRGVNAADPDLHRISLDLHAGTAICPAGLTVGFRATGHQRHAAVAEFGAACLGCPLAAQCTTAVTSRTITNSAYEAANFALLGAAVNLARLSVLGITSCAEQLKAPPDTRSTPTTQGSLVLVAELMDHARVKTTRCYSLPTTADR